MEASKAPMMTRIMKMTKVRQQTIKTSGKTMTRRRRRRRRRRRTTQSLQQASSGRRA
jgi:hypothetical protein